MNNAAIERMMTHGSIDTVARGMAQRAFLSTTDVLNAKRDFGAVGDGVADDTAALQAWINACFETGKPGYLPAASLYYRTTAPLVCFVPQTPESRWKGLTLYGTGAFGNPFAVYGLNRAACMIRGFHNGPVFHLDGYDSTGMTNSMDIWGIIFSGNSTVEPVFKVNNWYGTGSLGQFCIFQYGTGDGFRSKYMITVQMSNGYIMGPQWANPQNPKNGTGLAVNVKLDGGGVRVERVTCRGFDRGFTVGDDSGTARMFQCVFDNCESSCNTTGFWFGNLTASCVIQNAFIEGSNINGVDIDIGGTGHRVVNNFNFAGAAVCIRLRSTASRCVVSGNELGVGSADGETIGIHVQAGSGGNIVAGNTVRQGAPPGVQRSRGILVEGASPVNHIYNNFLDPGTWLGPGSVPFADETTYPTIPGNTSGGLRGLVQQSNKANNIHFPSLQGAALNPVWENQVLTQADVSNTPRTDTLHLSGAMVYVLQPTSAVNVRAFAGRNMQGKLFYLVCRNSNVTFINSTGPGYLYTHTGANYTPPSTGAVITVFISPLGAAVFLSVTTPNLTGAPLL